MPERLVISNTSPLLYLHQVGHLEVLKGIDAITSSRELTRLGTVDSAEELGLA